MTADLSGAVFDLYALAIFSVPVALILGVRALRQRRRRPWWRS